VRMRWRKLLIAGVTTLAALAAILLVQAGLASAADAERDQAITAATAFAQRTARTGTPVLSVATKGGAEMLVAAHVDVPPDLTGKQFWVVSFAGDFAPLRPLPPGAAAAGGRQADSHLLTVYVLSGRVVGGHGGP
jgi:hypothetical protein